MKRRKGLILVFVVLWILSFVGCSSTAYAEIRESDLNKPYGLTEGQLLQILLAIQSAQSSGEVYKRFLILEKNYKIHGFIDVGTHSDYLLKIPKFQRRSEILKQITLENESIQVLIDRWLPNISRSFNLNEDVWWEVSVWLHGDFVKIAEWKNGELKWVE